jgi:SAM-dependent methyltransferase
VKVISSKQEVHDERGGSLSGWLQRRRFDVGRPYLRGRVLDFGSHHGVLTQYCKPDAYLGVEHDPTFIEAAREAHPEYTFVTELPKDDKFDTVAAFALIEHIKDPGALLAKWAEVLAPDGRIVLTTPHPKFEWIHTVGAKVGLFSHHAHEDHEDLIDKKLMTELGAPIGLVVDKYKRFLFGANQLFVLRRSNG